MYCIVLYLMVLFFTGAFYFRCAAMSYDIANCTILTVKIRVVTDPDCCSCDSRDGRNEVDLKL